MQPQTSQDQLDPSIVRLAQAISKTETRGTKNPYQAKGGSGEYGAYQYTPPTWAADSKAFLGQDVPLEQATPEQQDKVAYYKIQSLGKKGYKPNQIASIWNSGKPDSTGNVGVNKSGVKYDTPSYVKSVEQAYNQLQQGQHVNVPATTSTVGNTQAAPPDPQNTFSTPLHNLALGDGQQNVDYAKGAVKGALQDFSGAGAQDAGPVGAAMLRNAPDFAKNIDAAKSFMQTSGNAQAQGAALSHVGFAAIGPGEVKAGLEASRLAKVPEIAESLAAPKQTLKTVARGLMSLGGNARTTSDAAAIRPLVESGSLKAGATAKATLHNVATLKNEIVSTAQGLVTRLRGMDVQPTVQPEELDSIFKQQVSSIERNVPPSGQQTAKDTAQWIWGKFINNLPKGRQLSAEDILSARKATDAEVEAIKGQNVFDPATDTGFSVALRAFRQGANDLLESKAPNQGAKNALAYQTSLYNVLENLASKGASAVKKAQEVSSATGLKGLVSRHPYISGLAGAVGTAGVEALGLTGAARLLGVNFSNQ